MSNFITIIRNTEIASSEEGVRITGQYTHVSGETLLERLKINQVGEKDGSHFLRTRLKIAESGRLMTRADSNMESLASCLIIDCDKRINQIGQEIEGAPDPLLIHNILKNLDIGHVIYGSYSYYSGGKGNRYRIILASQKPYNKDQLAAIAEAIVLLINQNIDEELLAYAKENSVFSQAWYHPRKPENCIAEHLYFEHLEGLAIRIVEPKNFPPTNHAEPQQHKWSGNQISPIQTFNEQYGLTELLSQYGYKRKLVTGTHEKWLSPDSSSRIAGITVKDSKFFSHHNDPLNDGYWHDAFDLMRVREGLSHKEAIIKAARITTARDGRPVDEYNKRSRNCLVAHISSQPLPESRPTVLPFQAEMLPEAIRDYVYDVADRQQSLPDFVAVAAIVGLSGLLGRKALICPKQLDDWSVTPNQWGAIIGRPSAMKSPSMKEALKPLRQFDIKAAQQFEEDMKNYEEECQLIELEKLAAKNKAKSALKKDDREAAREALKLSESLALPSRKRLVVNDATIEKLGELLKENPNGLILVRDELSGWLAKLNKEEYQTDRAFYLECFDGNGYYSYDRIGRGTIVIQNCILSIIGGIQPSKIATLVRDAIRGTADDGLIQRFQLAIWPDDIGCWEWIDRAPNQQAKEKYNAVFEILHNLSFNTEDKEPHQFRFTDEAQILFITWMKEIQDAARSSEIHPALESHMLKMPQTIAGLALLFEIIDGGRETVGLTATARALEWADYLISHAKRLYSLAINHSLDGARLILERKSKLDDPLTARTIQRKGWSGLNSIEDVNDALNWLIDYGHIVAKTLSSADTNGRPKIVYQWLSPPLLKGN
jgi:HPt (histidine-containing phosphotransfer) domain-containing protein